VAALSVGARHARVAPKRNPGEGDDAGAQEQATADGRSVSGRPRDGNSSAAPRVLVSTFRWRGSVSCFTLKGFFAALRSPMRSGSSQSRRPEELRLVDVGSLLSVPVTTKSASRQPHSEHTSRSRQSRIAVSGVSLGHVGEVGLGLVRAFLARYDQPNPSRSESGIGLGSELIPNAKCYGT
jgi:hypothetical protein